MKNNQFPFISIVVLNYNGYGITDLCLASLFKSKYPAFEVIVVDNASWDGSLELIEKIFSAEERLIIIRNTKNLYFAEGNNVGIRQARGEYIIILNNDTEVEPNWLIEFLKVLEKDKAIGAAQAKLLRMGTDNFYDCAGDYLGPLGFLIDVPEAQKTSGNLILSQIS